MNSPKRQKRKNSKNSHDVNPVIMVNPNEPQNPSETGESNSSAFITSSPKQTTRPKSRATPTTRSRKVRVALDKISTSLTVVSKLGDRTELNSPLRPVREGTRRSLRTSSKSQSSIFSRHCATTSSATAPAASTKAESVSDEIDEGQSHDSSKEISERSMEDEDLTHENDENQTPDTVEAYSYEFDLYHFIASLPPLTTDAIAHPGILPRQTRSSPPITLVLDLDETLVHCSTTPLDKPDVVFPVEFGGQTYTVMGRFRPFYEFFLSQVSQLFEVVIFTASQKIYADKILNIIDPERKFIKLFRDSCTHVFGNYIKDLNILGRDMSKILIVDNSPQAFAYQISNGIPITSWYDDDKDQELLQVLEFLQSIHSETDVRPHVEKKYRLKERLLIHADSS